MLPVGCDVLAQVVYTAQVCRSLPLQPALLVLPFPRLRMEADKVTKCLLQREGVVTSALVVLLARWRSM